MSTQELQELTDNQRQFVRDAREQGHEVDFTYSGRFMYGETCPSIQVDNMHSFNTDADVQTDQMGLGYVIYAKN